MPNLTPSIIFHSHNNNLLLGFIHFSTKQIKDVTALTYWSSFIDGYNFTLPKDSSEQDCVNITAPMVDHDETFRYNYKAEKFLDGTGLVQVPKGTFSIVVKDGTYNRCM